AHDLLFGVEHQAYDVGLARPQTHAGAVRTVADLPGDELHAPPGLLADLGRVLQRTRHGGDTEARHEGDRLQRWAAVGGPRPRPAAARRIFVVHRRAHVSSYSAGPSPERDERIHSSDLAACFAA